MQNVIIYGVSLSGMELLDKVQNKDGITEWSCVYNLDDFTVTICLDADYGQSYSFSAKEF